MLTLGDILAIEDDDEILGFRCPETGWLAWSAVRHQFLGTLIFELAYRWPALVLPTPTVWQRRHAITALLKALSDNAAARRRGIDRRPILMFATGAGVVPWDGKSLNRLSDHLALATPGQSVVWEEVAYPHYAIPRNRVNPDILYALPYMAQRFARARLHRSSAIDWLAEDFVRYLAARSARLFGLTMPESRVASTKAAIIRMVSRNAIDRRHYEALYGRGQPRIVLLEEASYGHYAPAIVVARTMGIPVAEFQHGFVTRGYRAYNYAPTLCASAEYRSTLPDYFLSYGPWWHDRFNAPIKRIAIGNPHRSESLARVRQAMPVERKDVLILAKAEEAGRYLALAVALDRLAQGRLRVVFRAKPSDLRRVAVSPGSIGTVIIDQNADLYTSLASADVVVSGPSTTLMEAVGIARRIFMWDDAAGRFQYPEPVFERFTDAADLHEKLAAPPDPGVVQPAEAEAWAPDWRARYKDFIAPFLR